jgi:Protein of unknown function (DUF742)
MEIDDWSDPTRLVPPYAMTGGRARPVLAPEELELESLVSTTSLGETSVPALTPEQQSIVLLCRDILSIAEVSAHLDVPVGVARVLVGDMAAEGLVTLHRPAGPGIRPDLALLERVLYGLRAL